MPFLRTKDFSKRKPLIEGGTLTHIHLNGRQDESVQGKLHRFIGALMRRIKPVANRVLHICFKSEWKLEVD